MPPMDVKCPFLKDIIFSIHLLGLDQYKGTTKHGYVVSTSTP